MPPLLPLTKREKAFAAYIETGSKVKACEASGLSRNSVVWLIRNLKWYERRRALVKRIEQETEEAAAGIIRSHQNEVIRGHLEMAKKLRKHIVKKLDSAETPDGGTTLETDQLAEISRAGKAASDIDARVIGLDADGGRHIANTNTFMSFNMAPERDDGPGPIEAEVIGEKPQPEPTPKRLTAPRQSIEPVIPLVPKVHRQ